MIKVETNAKEVGAFMRRARMNIKRSQTTLARRLTLFTKSRVEMHAPSWRNTLKGKVAMKIFPKSHRGEVMMASPFYNMVALQNEFNIGGRRKLYKSAYPKLGAWAEDKGIFIDKPYVIVGGSGTRLGGINRFFEPSFFDVQKALHSIASEVIGEALMKTR